MEMAAAAATGKVFMSQAISVGLISDTHGAWDPLLAELFRDVAWILHAGDVGEKKVLERLNEIAPTQAVAGNVDKAPELARLPRLLTLSLAHKQVLLTHYVGEVDDPLPSVKFVLDQSRPDVVVFGHTHRRLLRRSGPVLFINPGSAGSPRGAVERMVAILEIQHGACKVRFCPL